MTIYEVYIYGNSCGHFKSKEKAIKEAKRIVKEQFFNTEWAEQELYETVCNELDEQSYSTIVEADIYEHELDMED